MESEGLPNSCNESQGADVMRRGQQVHGTVGQKKKRHDQGIEKNLTQLLQRVCREGRIRGD